MAKAKSKRKKNSNEITKIITKEYIISLGALNAFKTNKTEKWQFFLQKTKKTNKQTIGITRSTN